MAVKPALQMKFDIQDSMDSIVFLVEVIRTYDGWEEDYIKKLIRYGQYLKSVEDTQSLKKYYIVVCAESEKQVNDVINIYYDLKTRKQVSEVLGIQICYTCDIIHFLRREMLDFTAFPVFFVSNLLLVQRKKYYFNRATVSRNCSIVL